MAGLVRTGLRRNDRAAARRWGSKADVPEVPTFQPSTAAAREPQSIAAAEDPSEEAVRRIVEAAYT
jgi:hypothetical protein